MAALADQIGDDPMFFALLKAFNASPATSARPRLQPSKTATIT
jgi:hypothetical protein